MMTSPSVLADLFREAGHPLLMPYATGGFPDVDGCARLLRAYQEAGADIVELGVPFSDPLADGPVIQGSSQQALRQGVRPDDVFRLAAGAAAQGVNIVFLAYLNTVLARGPERFFGRCAESGVLGVVIPDLPVEEAAELQGVARVQGVDVVLLAAPTSPEHRLAAIGRQASGFIYCVSATGVTGVRSEMRSDLPEFLARLRRHTELPLAVGFGVSTPDQAAEVGRHADGVIIGSRLVAMVQEAGSVEAALPPIREFLGEVRERLRS